MNYKSCLLVINPGGSQVDAAKKHVQQLKDHFTDSFTRYELQKSDISSPKKLIVALSTLSDDSLLVIAGGDGTVSMVINHLLSLPSAQRTTVLPLWAGNANDIAHMLNGAPVASITDVLTRSHRKAAYPIALKSDGKAGLPAYALAYFSIGATGGAMRAIEKGDSKVSTFAEIILSLKSLFTAPRFSASFNNKRGKYFELAFLNGSKIAKYYPAPTKLSHRSMAAVVVRLKHPILIGHLVALVRAHFATPDISTRYAMLLHEKVPAQLDGETHSLPAGTSLTISSSQTSYYVATTKE